MRKVLLNKYKYTYKDGFRWIGTILMHFIGFYALLMILLAIHYAANGSSFFPFINESNWGILYPMTIAPFLSGIAHIVYSERGYTSVKAFIWLHALAVAILVIVVLFTL